MFVKCKRSYSQKKANNGFPDIPHTCSLVPQARLVPSDFLKLVPPSRSLPMKCLIVKFVKLLDHSGASLSTLARIKYLYAAIDLTDGVHYLTPAKAGP
jgi:hypothetical protein